MPTRPTMAGLIARVRQLINDTVSATEQFGDQEIQDVLDESRIDVVNGQVTPKPTFTGSTIQYLNYYTALGNWEDDYVLKQYLTITVAPSFVEPISGHFQFTLTTLPPVYITGKTYDCYRASADLLERLAARWVMSYNMTVDGQSLQRGQVVTALQNLAKTYRQKQRASTIRFSRSDINRTDEAQGLTLAPQPIDYMSSG